LPAHTFRRVSSPNSHEESRTADIHTRVDWLAEGYLLSVSVEKATSQQLIGLLPLRQLNYYPDILNALDLDTTRFRVAIALQQGLKPKPPSTMSLCANRERPNGRNASTYVFHWMSTCLPANRSFGISSSFGAVSVHIFRLQYKEPPDYHINDVLRSLSFQIFGKRPTSQATP
jgi:hypothetical protein